MHVAPGGLLGGLEEHGEFGVGHAEDRSAEDRGPLLWRKLSQPGPQLGPAVLGGPHRRRGAPLGNGLHWDRAPARLDEPRRELDQYFEGRRTKFELPIDWSHLRGFTQKVLRETARIDFGELRTYADVAAGAGSPRAVRAAGNALGANPMPIVVPCHRVVRTGGGIGGYTGGLERKEFLLRLEGTLR